MDTVVVVDEPTTEKLFRVAAEKPTPTEWKKFTPEEKEKGEKKVSHVFVITEKMLNMSAFLSESVANTMSGMDAQQVENTVLPMANVDKVSTVHLMKFMEFHKNDDPDDEEELTVWDRDFLKESRPRSWHGLPGVLTIFTFFFHGTTSFLHCRDDQKKRKRNSSWRCSVWRRKTRMTSELDCWEKQPDCRAVPPDPQPNDAISCNVLVG